MVRGSCLCGGVTIEIEGALEHQPEACHCTQCRKHAGHIFVGVNVRRDALTIHGTEKITWFRSSDEVRRGFCSACGSTLFWDSLRENYNFISVAMGIFDAPTGTALAKHIFVADKGDYYEIDDGLPQSDRY